MSREQFDNELRGVLFKNDKQGVETRSDYRGDCQIHNVEYWVDAWINTSREGREFLSLRFKSKNAARAQGNPREPPPIVKPTPRKDDFSDDIPF
jgi:hypothetical protein